MLPSHSSNDIAVHVSNVAESAGHVASLVQAPQLTAHNHVPQPQGPLGASGTFWEECTGATISAAVQQLVKPFYSAASPPSSYVIWGTKLLVINQTDSQFVAVSKQRRLGVLAVNLAGGVLLASFDRTQQPEAALAAVKDAYSTGIAGMPSNSYSS